MNSGVMENNLLRLKSLRPRRVVACSVFASAGSGHVLAVLAFVLVVVAGLAFPLPVYAQSVRPPDNAVNRPVDMPGPPNTLGNRSQSDYWSDLRHGKSGLSTTGGPGGVLIQAQGETWRLLRRQVILQYTPWVLGAVLAVLIVFFLVRGRVKFDGGPSGRKIARFSLSQRTAHWFMAGVFIFLSLTGLVLLLGRSLVMPVIGKQAHSILVSASMQGHNLFGPVFAVALVWLYYQFVPGNFLQRVDLKWLARGGGLFGGHASADRYNFGEKVWFWLVAVAGLAMTVSGLILEFPWLAADLRLLQVSTIVHAAGAVSLISFAFGHIYLGTIGTRGSLEAMTTGEVDENWAKTHHDRWFENMTGRNAGQGQSDTGHAEVWSQQQIQKAGEAGQ